MLAAVRIKVNDIMPIRVPLEKLSFSKFNYVPHPAATGSAIPPRVLRQTCGQHYMGVITIATQDADRVRELMAKTIEQIRQIVRNSKAEDDG